MSRSEPADPRSSPASERPPSWMGAPGFTPSPELSPHAPMPGAPPYPAAQAPVDRDRPAVVGFPRVLAAVAVWAAVNVVLLAVAPVAVSGGRFAAGLAVSALLAALVGWLWGRRRRWPFWLVLVSVAPLFWLLRALVTLVLG